MIRVFIRKHRLLLTLSVLFIILRLPSLFEPDWYGDEGIYLTLGQAIRRGWVVYSQIHDNKPPSLYYLAAISQTVFGFRLLLLIWMIPTIYYFYQLSCHFFSHRLSVATTVIFLVLTSIPLLEGNIANAEIFMLLPTILGVYLFIKYQKYFLSSLLLGFAFTIKIPVAIEFAFLFAWLIFIKSKLKISQLLILTLGFFAPIIIWGIYFYFHGALPQFLFAAIFQNFGYLSSWATGSHSGSASDGGLLSRTIMLCIFFGLIYLGYRFKKISAQTAFLLFWFISTIFGTLLSSRPYPHYLIQVLPPLCLLFGLLISGRYPTILAFLFLAIIIIRFKFYFYPVVTYYVNSYSYLLGFKSQLDYQSFFGQNIDNNYQLSSYLKKNTTPNDRLFVWGDQPYIYPLSDRLPIGRYTVAYHIIDFRGYDETINAIKIYQPKFIIIFPMANRPFPELDRIVDNYYIFDRSFNSASVYRLR